VCILPAVMLRVASLASALNLEMASDLRASRKALRSERSERPIDRGLRATNSRRASPVNNNSNANTVYGPVHTVINNNPISNLAVYGVMPNETVCSTGATSSQCPLTNTVIGRYPDQIRDGTRLNSTGTRFVSDIS